jgi:hypothetical protein
VSPRWICLNARAVTLERPHSSDSSALAIKSSTQLASDSHCFLEAYTTGQKKLGADSSSLALALGDKPASESGTDSGLSHQQLYSNKFMRA